VIGLLGGAFDPPHTGHVALVRTAKDVLALDRLVVLVSASPEHKAVATPAAARLKLAEAAFPDDDVVLDEHGRTIDLLEAHPEWRDATFVVGGDEFADFLGWKRPQDVLRLVRLAVATRPGVPHDRLERVVSALDRPERVTFFELPPTPVASRDLRPRLEAGEDVSGELPAAVAAMIEADGLYRR
jgi:nicotinate-nucleotide adenylyltransferase